VPELWLVDARQESPAGEGGELGVAGEAQGDQLVPRQIPEAALELGAEPLHAQALLQPDDPVLEGQGELPDVDEQEAQEHGREETRGSPTILPSRAGTTLAGASPAP